MGVIVRNPKIPLTHHHLRKNRIYMFYGFLRRKRCQYLFHYRLSDVKLIKAVRSWIPIITCLLLSFTVYSDTRVPYYCSSILQLSFLSIQYFLYSEIQSDSQHISVLPNSITFDFTPVTSHERCGLRRIHPFK